MEGLEKITARIIADAKAAAVRIEEEAEKRSEVLLSDAKQTAENILKDNRRQTEADVTSLLQRGQSMVRSEIKKYSLQKRQEKIEAAIQSALEKLATDPAAEKLKRYVRMVKAAKIQGGEIVLAPSDRDLGSELLRELGQTFSLASESGDFIAGLIIKQGKIEDNLTFDLAIRNARAELTHFVAELIEEK
ncbi:MAG TPA: hypothetical protein GXX72_00945 [Clostridiaceae bacterium]|nr:hypothetical protein [Clostridiaceae bacterium]